MRLLHSFALASLLSTSVVQADPAAFVGLSYTWGGNIGISAKILSDDEEDNAIVAAGVSYYPFAQNKFGLDVGAGYAIDNSAVLISYDFLQKSVQGSIGWADTENEDRIEDVPPAPLPPMGP